VIAEHSTWQNFSKALQGYIQNRELYYPKPSAPKKQNDTSKGFFGSFFSTSTPVEAEPPKPRPPTLPYIKKVPGLYIHGNPGIVKHYFLRVRHW
jgi:hypothetical protein